VLKVVGRWDNAATCDKEARLAVVDILFEGDHFHSRLQMDRGPRLVSADVRMRQAKKLPE
jgi:hypothetical protein